MLCARAVLVGILASLLIGVGTPPLAADPDRLTLRLRQGEFDPLLDPSPLPEKLRFSKRPTAGKFIVQFNRPIDAGLLAALRADGIEPLAFLPRQAWIVRLPEGGGPRLLARGVVRWMGPVEPGFKLSPELDVRGPAVSEARDLAATLDLFPGEPIEPVTRALVADGVELLGIHAFSDTRRILVRATREQLERAARLTAVSWIEPRAEIRLRNDTASWVIQSDVPELTSIWKRGLDGEGEIIGHIDGPIDLGSCFFRDPSNNTPGPAHRKVVAYRSTSGAPLDTHGTHTAGTAAGDRSPIDGSHDGGGHAYAAKLSFADLFDLTGSGIASSNLYEFLAAAHADGARVHNNSWGDDESAAYTSWSRDVDRYAHDFEDAVVIFAVTNLSQLRSPENAKNALAVGATRNGLEGDTFCRGGTGPTADGRRKPELFAPGCGIVSAAPGDCETVEDSGTSMAAPAVAGAAALVRQYFREGWYPGGVADAAAALDPSAALVRAVLINAGEDLTSIAGYPTDQEGWGRLVLEQALHFDGDTRRLAVVADVANAVGLSTGADDLFELTLDKGAEPLELTLVYTDPPASLLALDATVNDLDLVLVSPSGTSYLGNVFDAFSGVSVPGGQPDTRNTVEVVLVPDPEPGDWRVEVRGTAVNEGPQGYALVATGAVSSPAGSSLRYVDHLIADDGPLANGDGVVDPGETLTLPVELLNLGRDVASGVSARLSADRPDRVQVTRHAAGYADIPGSASDTSLAPHFELTIAPDVECGSSLGFEMAATHDAGTRVSTFSVLVGNTQSGFPADDTPLELPTFAGSPTTSMLEIESDFLIADITLELHVTHPDIGELLIELTSPAGTTVRLHDRTGSGTPNLQAIYDLDRAPDGPGAMSWFDGEAALGTWTLSVLDDVIGGFPPTPAGTIESWVLRFEAPDLASCRPLDCAGAPPPAAVGPSLRLDADGADDLRYSWDGVRGAAGYRVWRSPTPDFAREEFLGESGVPSFVETGGRTSATNWYYRVRAVNSCNWSGP